MAQTFPNIRNGFDNFNPHLFLKKILPNISKCINFFLLQSSKGTT